MRKIRLVGASRYSYKRQIFAQKDNDGRQLVHVVKDELADYLLRQSDPNTGAPYFIEGDVPAPKKGANRPKAPVRRAKEVEQVKTEIVEPEDDAERQLAADEYSVSDDVDTPLPAVEIDEIVINDKGDGVAVPV